MKLTQTAQAGAKSGEQGNRRKTSCCAVLERLALATNPFDTACQLFLHCSHYCIPLYCFLVSSKILERLAQTVLGDCAASTPVQIWHNTKRELSTVAPEEANMTHALLLVVVGDGVGLLVVGLETLPEGLGGVV